MEKRTKRTKRPAVCTIGPAAISAAVAEFSRLPLPKQLALLRRRADTIRRKKPWNMTAAEVAWIDAVDALPEDPGEGDPCRPLWGSWMLQHYESDQAATAYWNCRREYPLEPPPIKV